MVQDFDLIVIGAGIAGLTAADHAAENGLRVAHVIGMEAPGGLVVNVGQLDGLEGPDGDPVGGIDLATTLLVAAMDKGVAQVAEAAERIETAGTRHIVHAGDERLSAPAVILATGARLKMLDVPGADRLVNLGVSQCGWCDGPLHKGNPVAVIGGGDAAFEEALHLADIASSVTIILRSAEPRARVSYVAAAAADSRIRLLTSTDVTEVVGTDKVESLRLRRRDEGRDETLPVSAVFIFIGLEPNTGLISPSAVRDASGALVTDAAFKTSEGGIYVIGAARSGYSGRLADAIVEARRCVDGLMDQR